MPSSICIFLDTNVYIVGSADPNTTEGQILRWADSRNKHDVPVEIIVSQVLFDQILRVAKRLRGKDWGGEIINHIANNFWVKYVLVDDMEWLSLMEAGIIPREDVEIYLTARNGKADCFVSANHELIRILAQTSGEFECLNPTEFVEKYLS